MRLEYSFLLLFLILAASPGLAKANRSILFGVNYLPQVTCVEEFTPYWRTDNWTEKRVVTDMKIMKAMGCSCVRLALYPALPGKTPSWGEPAEKFLPMLDLMVKTAGEVGLKVHLDICDEVETYGEEGVRFSLNRYKGKIESYQFGNEAYDWPKNPEQLKWLQGLIKLAHSIDPNAKISADIHAPEWAMIRKDHPDFYKDLDLTLAHYYSITDHRGWNQLYIDDLVDYLSNTTGRHPVSARTYEEKKKVPGFDEYDARSKWWEHDWYAGSYGWFDKDLWLSEITVSGYWPWGNLVPEKKRAADWEKIVDALAGADNRLTRVYHWCFRDKMSDREFGAGQCGIVRYDGAPRPATLAFKKMARKYAPKDSALAAVDCKIERVNVPESATTAELKVRLTNKTGNPLKGSFTLELPDDTAAKQTSFQFTLQNRAKTWKIPIDVLKTHWGANHVFARVEIPQGLVYGWGIIAKPKRVELASVSPLGARSELVRYPGGLEPVQEFFDKYGDDCAIVIGPGVGTDAEMGTRLKIVLLAMGCKNEIQTRSSVNAIDALNRPLIVIGSPEFNLIAKTIELGLPPEQRITSSNPGPGKGVVMVVKEPFGEPTVHGRFSRQSQHVGYFFGGCPEVLYIAGSDDDGTKAAAYDLIGRIWGKEEKYR